MAFRAAAAAVACLGAVVASPGSSVLAKVQATQEVPRRDALVVTAAAATPSLADRIASSEYQAGASDLDAELLRGAADAEQARLDDHRATRHSRGALLAASVSSSRGESQQARAARYFKTHDMQAVGKLLEGQ
mmetsp:Transcript_36070/g.103737  ORF Transcript_36070/g.103737 Transcript_36070/m.103737 type:complete len:133 (+) Transcript_36070:69-467(+)